MPESELIHELLQRLEDNQRTFRVDNMVHHVRYLILTWLLILVLPGCSAISLLRSSYTPVVIDTQASALMLAPTVSPTFTLTATTLPSIPPPPTLTRTRILTHTPRPSQTPALPLPPIETHIPIASQVVQHELIKLDTMHNEINDLAWSLNSKTLFAGTAKKGFMVFDVESHKMVSWFGDYGVQSLVISPDGNTLVVSNIKGDEGIYFLDSASLYTNLLEIAHAIVPAHQARIKRMVFSPAGTQLASCSLDSHVKIWDAVSGDLIQDILSDGMCSSLAYSPDGSRLYVSGSEHNNITLYETQIWTKLSPFGETQSNDLEISPDGTHLVTAPMGGNVVEIYNTYNGDKLFDLSTGESCIWKVSYDPLGRYIASGGTCYNIVLWNANNGKPVYKLIPDEIGASTLVFSPDGKWLAFGVNAIYLWKVP